MNQPFVKKKTCLEKNFGDEEYFSHNNKKIKNILGENIDENQFENIVNAVKEIDKKLDDFFSNNPDHEYYLNKTSFREINFKNKRFCKICLFQQVYFFKIKTAR